MTMLAITPDVSVGTLAALAVAAILVAAIAISAYAAERENVRQLREILARLEKIGGCK